MSIDSHIANKSAVIDVYLWLAYRLHILEQPVSVTWSALQAQFGSNYQRLSGFKPRFVEILEQALAVYPQARVEVGDKCVCRNPRAHRARSPDRPEGDVGGVMRC